jgi:hypothetical protein
MKLQRWGRIVNITSARSTTTRIHRLVRMWLRRSHTLVVRERRSSRLDFTATGYRGSHYLLSVRPLCPSLPAFDKAEQPEAPQLEEVRRRHLGKPLRSLLRRGKRRLGRKYCLDAKDGPTVSVRRRSRMEMWRSCLHARRPLFAPLSHRSRAQRSFLSTRLLESGPPGDAGGRILAAVLCT